MSQLHTHESTSPAAAWPARQAGRFAGGFALNDNTPAGGHCPACNAYAPLSPASAEYHAKGLIHHHWHCEACGHDWVTVLHVLTS